MDPIHFVICVLIDKLINVHEASAHSDHYLLAFFNFDVNTFLAKLVDALGLSEEHDLHSIVLRPIIYKFGENLIGFVAFSRDVDVIT